MLTKLQAQKLAEMTLGITDQNSSQNTESDFKIDEDAVWEFEYGWVFPFNSRRYLETGDIRFALAGNGPLIVDKFKETVVYTGTSRPTNYYVDSYMFKNYSHEVDWLVERFVAVKEGSLSCDYPEIIRVHPC